MLPSKRLYRHSGHIVRLIPVCCIHFAVFLSLLGIVLEMFLLFFVHPNSGVTYSPLRLWGPKMLPIWVIVAPWRCQWMACCKVIHPGSDRKAEKLPDLSTTAKVCTWWKVGAASTVVHFINWDGCRTNWAELKLMFLSHRDMKGVLHSLI